MEDSVKLAHEKFVSGHEGSSPSDVVLAILPALPGVFASIFLSGVCKGRIGFLIQYALCVVPLLVAFTFLNDITVEVSLVTGVLAVVGYVKFVADDEKLAGQSNYPHFYQPFITFCKSIINIATILAILAVDFNCFPRRFAKTEEYGYSLMDIGVACYVFMHGLVDVRRRVNSNSSIFGTISFLILGCLRLASVRSANYQHHITEYGLHANFFFVLALLKITCSWWVPAVSVRSGLVVSTLLSLIHSSMLMAGLEVWTLSDAPRLHFFEANREFFVSFLGYVTIYVLGATAGDFFLSQRYRKDERKQTCLAIACVVVSAILFNTMDTLMGFRPSRRLANPTFVAWTSCFMMFFLTGFKLMQMLVEYILARKIPNVLLLDKVNQHPLLFFLTANIFTGLINMSINTLLVPFPLDFGILVIYSVVLLYFILW